MEGLRPPTKRQPRDEDFVITEKKDIFKAPRPVDTVINPEWVQPSSRPQRTEVSTRNMGSAWGKMVEETNDLFGKSPIEMMVMCERFIEQTRDLDRFGKAEAYIKFYSTFFKTIQCGP